MIKMDIDSLPYKILRSQISHASIIIIKNLKFYIYILFIEVQYVEPLYGGHHCGNKTVHYREGVLWSGVYYTLCGLYLVVSSKCPL